MRILVPLTPYNVDTMKEVVHLIIGSFEDLDDTNSTHYSRRVTILKTFTKIKTSILLVDLRLQDQVHNMFHYLFIMNKNTHNKDIFLAMKDIMILAI